MTEHAERTARQAAGPMPDAPHGPGAEVETLASRALGLLAARRGHAAALLSERFLDDLAAAVCSADPERRARVVRDMRAAGLRREEIADFYVPEVARRLGAAWCEDQTSFAEVTVGTARLQGLLRELGPDWFRDRRTDPDAACVLVAVRAEEFHTLGALLLAAQLGRLGASVRLVMGRNDSEIVDVVASTPFDAIFLSVSQAAQLASVGKLVEKIRKASPRAAPVVLGGSVVTRVTDVRAQTGADHATTDAREALRACGLTVSASGARPRMTSE